MIKVFVSSPYSGNVEENVQFQVDIGNELMDLGFFPFTPLLYDEMEKKKSRSYDFWIHFTAAWITDCNCLLRVGGESKGADGEVKLAKEKNIPVFYSIEELNKYYTV